MDEEETHGVGEHEANEQFSPHLLAHLIDRPKQVVEVQEREGVPNGREGALERVRLSLLDTHHHYHQSFALVVTDVHLLILHASH